MRCHRCGGLRVRFQQLIQPLQIAVVISLRFDKLLLGLLEVGHHLLCLRLRLLNFCGGFCKFVEPFGVEVGTHRFECLLHFGGGLAALGHHDLRLLRERCEVEKIIDLCIVCHIFSNLQYYFHVKTYTLAIFARKSLKKEFAVSLFAGMEVGTRAKDTGEKPASPKLRSIRSQ